MDNLGRYMSGTVIKTAACMRGSLLPRPLCSALHDVSQLCSWAVTAPAPVLWHSTASRSCRVPRCTANATQLKICF